MSKVMVTIGLLLESEIPHTLMYLCANLLCVVICKVDIHSDHLFTSLI